MVKNKKNNNIIRMLLVALLLAMAFLLYQFFGPTVRQPNDRFLYIKKGTSLTELKQQLTTAEIVRSLTWFNLVEKYLPIEKVKPGKYEIQKGMSVLRLVRMLRNGTQTPVQLVITKVRTKEQLAGKIGKAFECDSLATLFFLNSADSLQPYGLDSNTVMAAVLPLTYEANWSTTPAVLFEKFYTAYTHFWTEERKQKAKAQGITALQAATLASIVDEETNAAKEKGTIASVYMNRIAKGMPLQADPTVKFALKDFSIKRVLNKHLQTPSLYNTYKHKGLPPGPICTPLQQTVDAVLNASPTSYLYFVASPAFDGTHVFTTNYADHMKHAKAYQQALDERFGKITHATTTP